MEINGLQKLTLLDYPTQTAATVFLSGCNFRCPFCHNSDLVLPNENADLLAEETFFAFLAKRQGLLDGVCITGGEPTLRPGLIVFAQRIKDMGYLVKLDTNGTKPAVICAMIEHNVVDYIAMDIKNAPEKYALTAGIPTIMNATIIKDISNSIEIIMNAPIQYEFRTTAVRELHTQNDFQAIGKWIKGAKQYVIQNFVDSEKVIKSGYHGFNKLELQSFQNQVKPYIKNVKLRGI